MRFAHGHGLSVMQRPGECRDAPARRTGVAPAVNWNRKLARVLILEDDTRLITLRDAGLALDRYFSAVTKSPALAATIEALMHAARTGKRADIAAATDRD